MSRAGEMSTQTATKLEGTLGGGVTATPLTVDGEDYIITTGTGEGTFAYEPEDVATWLASWAGVTLSDEPSDEHVTVAEVYEHFCSHCQPVEDKAVAVAWLIETQDTGVLCAAGTCSHLLTDDEVHALTAPETWGTECAEAAIDQGWVGDADAEAAQLWAGIIGTEGDRCRGIIDDARDEAAALAWECSVIAGVRERLSDVD